MVEFRLSNPQGTNSSKVEVELAAKGMTSISISEHNSALIAHAQADKATEQGLLAAISNASHSIATIGGLETTFIKVNGAFRYERLPSTPVDRPTPEDVKWTAFQPFISGIQLLLITATEIERDAVYRRLSRGPKAHFKRSNHEGMAITVGDFAGLKAAHVQCKMGSGGTHGSQQTTNNAINLIKPGAIAVLGIGYGADPTKQRLGDVLVAEAIVPYELSKVSSSQTLPRGIPLASGRIFRKAFHEYAREWTRVRADGTKVEIHFGPVLSGEKVINDPVFKSSLQTFKPTPVGGEMEGAGAYAAAEHHKAEIILIKAICDWADGNKSDAAQPFAAENAVALAEHVLAKPDAISSLVAKAPHQMPSQIYGAVGVLTVVIMFVAGYAFCGDKGVNAEPVRILTDDVPPPLALSDKHETINSEFLKFNITSDQDARIALARLREFEASDQVLRPSPALFDVKIERNDGLRRFEINLPGQTAENIGSEIRKVANSNSYPTQFTLNADYTLIRGKGISYSIKLNDGGTMPLMSIRPRKKDGGLATADEDVEPIMIFAPASALVPSPTSEAFGNTAAAEEQPLHLSPGPATPP